MTQLLATMLMLLLAAACGSTGDDTKTCNFPTLVEQTPDGGDSLFLCGDGSILECSEGSCAFGGGTAGSPNSGNPSDFNNPVDSNNRTTINPTPTPTPDRLTTR
jgi:hypothetical protein